MVSCYTSVLKLQISLICNFYEFFWNALTWSFKIPQRPSDANNLLLMLEHQSSSVFSLLVLPPISPPEHQGDYSWHNFLEIDVDFILAEQKFIYYQNFLLPATWSASINSSLKGTIAWQILYCCSKWFLTEYNLDPTIDSWSYSQIHTKSSWWELTYV